MSTAIGTISIMIFSASALLGQMKKGQGETNKRLDDIAAELKKLTAALERQSRDGLEYRGLDVTRTPAP